MSLRTGLLQMHLATWGCVVHRCAPLQQRPLQMAVTKPWLSLGKLPARLYWKNAHGSCSACLRVKQRWFLCQVSRLLLVLCSAVTCCAVLRVRQPPIQPSHDCMMTTGVAGINMAAMLPFAACLFMICKDAARYLGLVILTIHARNSFCVCLQIQQGCL